MNKFIGVSSVLDDFNLEIIYGETQIVRCGSESFNLIEEYDKSISFHEELIDSIYICLLINENNLY